MLVGVGVWVGKCGQEAIEARSWHGKGMELALSRARVLEGKRRGRDEGVAAARAVCVVACTHGGPGVSEEVIQVLAQEEGAQAPVEAIKAHGLNLRGEKGKEMGRTTWGNEQSQQWQVRWLMHGSRSRAATGEHPGAAHASAH